MSILSSQQQTAVKTAINAKEGHSMKRSDLPVIIGKGLRKGVCAGRSELMKGGVDLYIVWLNRDVGSGGQFTGEDVDKVNAIIHFCDKESVKRTVDVLTDILMKWGDWDA
jgi:hypothetical protein